MLRRLVPALLTALVLLLSATGIALAKEGAEARMDAPIPRDAEPGSTIEVGWTAWTMEGETRHPIYGSPLVLVITSPDGTTTTEAAGIETKSGSGHYVAEITIPAGGVGEVSLGMRGVACEGAGNCKPSDLPLTFVTDPVVDGAAATTTGAGSAGPLGDGVMPAVALAIAILGLLAVGGVLASRRLRPVARGPMSGN